MDNFSTARWVVSQEDKDVEVKNFLALNPVHGKISGDQARRYFMKSNLPSPVLGQIWSLADMDSDGRLTLQEFIIAMHLIKCKLQGIEVPKTLPLPLKTSTDPPRAAAFGALDSKVSSALPSQVQAFNITPIGASNLGIPQVGASSLGMTSMTGLASVTGVPSVSGLPTRGGPPVAGISPLPVGIPPMMGQSLGSPYSGMGFSTMTAGSSTPVGMAVTGGAYGMSSPAEVFQGTAFSPQSSQAFGFGSVPVTPFAHAQSFSSLGQAHLHSGFNLHGGMPISSQNGPSSASLFGTPSSLDTLSMDSVGILSTTGKKASVSSASINFATKGDVGGSPWNNSGSNALPSSSGEPASLPSIWAISAPNRLRYTQVFKAADNEKSGFLAGEHARQLLIQSNVSPQYLAHIWELSDVNKDGCLELDEFIIAMHLIDCVKGGVALPDVLPTELVPHTLRIAGHETRNRSNSLGSSGRERSASFSEPFAPATFEDRRRLNWDRGQQELERRRRELQEKEQKEKEDRERKEREEEERKQRAREEAEKKRLEKLENERRQREEMEQEEERLRKQMAEKRLASQLEAERERQREWEKRRKEELLNQKGLEENIVSELKLRYDKLKSDLIQHDLKHSQLNTLWEAKKGEGHELHAAIARLNEARDKRVKEINRLQSELSQSRSTLASFVKEREKLMVELNQFDSSTTSEALGAIRSSAKQMAVGIDRLRKNVISIEAESATVTRDLDQYASPEVILALKAALQNKTEEHARLEQQLKQKRKEAEAISDRQKQEAVRKAEINRQRLEEAENRRRDLEDKKKREEDVRKKLEIELSKQREQEQEAMRQEQQQQMTSHRQRQEAWRATADAQKLDLAKRAANEAVLKHNVILADAGKEKESSSKSQDEPFQIPQDSVTKPVGSHPTRPRTRPQVSAAKFPSMDGIKMLVEPASKSGKDNLSQSLDRNQFSSGFQADFSAFANFDQSAPSVFSPTSGSPIEIKKPPPRPGVPRQVPPRPAEPAATSPVEELDNDAKQTRNDEELGRKFAESKKKEEREQERKAKAESQQKVLTEAPVKKEEVRKQQVEEQEDDSEKKHLEMKKKVEEMQRKRLEKKQQGAPKQAPQRPNAGPSQYVPVKTVRYKMMFAFEARNADELSLEEGDIVLVNEADTSAPAGWLRGSCKGSSGLLPGNYASKLPAENFSDYVDLDPAAQISREMPSVPESVVKREPLATVKPQPRPSQPTEVKAEVFPQLKPVPTTKSVPSPKVENKPKPLLPPNAPLKQISGLDFSSKDSSVIDDRTQRLSLAAEDNPDLSATYDFVGAPARQSIHGVADDLYAVPKKLTQAEESSTALSEDQSSHDVPGQAIGDGSAEGIQAVALYPFVAKKDDDLPFNKNDVVIVLQQEDQWWFGKCNEKTGWFPKSYVKLTGGGKTRSASQLAVAASDTVETESLVSNESSTSSHAHSDPGFLESQQPLGECVALFPYSGQEGDLTFGEGDVISIIKQEGEWWEGYCNGKYGAFPANYVKLKAAETAKIKPEVATVISKYTASGANELSLNSGQLIHVLQKNPSGWWQGELQARGKKRPTGWFPASHVKLLQQSKADSKPAGGSVRSKSASPESDSATQEDLYSVPARKKETYDQVLAIFSYTALREDELSFYKGSVINVISKEGDWWKGELNGQVGVFPNNYVQNLSDMPESPSQQWSGTFDSTLLKSMSKAERQRQNHIYELINTEQDYVNDLSLTLEVFYNPLADANMLTEQELNMVFVNWKELIMCNMKFLKALLVRKTMSATSRIEGIGDILVEMLPRFTPYIRFCSCQLKACKLLQDKVEKDPDFKAFEKKCAGDSRLKQNLPLSSYLLKPLQRITKYPLVIREILKYTPEDHHDREHLENALEAAEDLCSQVNEGVRSQESANRLEWLQARVNLEGLEETLVFNSQTNCLGQRKYLHHGTLHKHKSNKELKAFLFNDFFMMCRMHNPHFLSKSQFPIFHPDSELQFTVYRKPIFLNEIVVKLPTEPDVTDTLFHLSHIDKVYTFRCESRTNRDAWVNQLQKASQHFIETERLKRTKASRARSLIGSDQGRLVVTILEGADLQASDPNGTSDPYCEVSMGSQEHRTKVIPKTLNPKWNSKMVFNIKDLDQDVLCISVFDRDFFSPNDFLGRTEITVASIMAEGNGPHTKRLLLHEVPTGEILVTLELSDVKLL